MSGQETLTGEQADEDVLLSQKKTEEIELKSDLLPELLDRMERIEQRQKKLLRIMSDGDYTREEKKTELARAVMQSAAGLTTTEVRKIFDYTQSKNALELMRELAGEDESKFEVYEKSTPYRIVHRKKHGIGGY